MSFNEFEILISKLDLSVRSEHCLIYAYSVAEYGSESAGELAFSNALREVKGYADLADAVREYGDSVGGFGPKSQKEVILACSRILTEEPKRIPTERSEMDDAIDMLRRWYSCAKDCKHIKNPLAYSLNEVLKAVQADEDGEA